MGFTLSSFVVCKEAKEDLGARLHARHVIPSIPVTFSNTVDLRVHRV